jgi:hypothetical protein
MRTLLPGDTVEADVDRRTVFDHSCCKRVAILLHRPYAEMLGNPAA